MSLQRFGMSLFASDDVRRETRGAAALVQQDGTQPL